MIESAGPSVILTTATRQARRNMIRTLDEVVRKRTKSCYRNQGLSTCPNLSGPSRRIRGTYTQPMPEGIGSTQDAILDLLVASRRPMSAVALEQKLGRSRDRITRALHGLADRGLVELWMDTGAPRLLSYQLTVHPADTARSRRRDKRPSRQAEKRPVQRVIAVQGLFAGLPGDRVLAHDKDGKPVHTSVSKPDVDLAKVKLHLDDGSRLTNARANKLADDAIDRLLASRRRLADDAMNRLLANRRRPRREDDPGTYVLALGENLLKVRKQKGLSLLAVEDISGGEFKHSALDAYERGERIISVLRLHRLAQLYGVSVDQLLPEPIGPGSGPDRNGDSETRRTRAK